MAWWNPIPPLFWNLIQTILPKKARFSGTPEKYKAAVEELDKRDIQICTHAIGDRAVRTALDAYESVEKKNHTKDHRNRVEHIETITAADIPRFGKLGVIASMQPLHAYPDEDTLDVWRQHQTGARFPRMGLERYFQRWRALRFWKRLAGCYVEPLGRNPDRGDATDQRRQAFRRICSIAKIDCGGSS